MTLMLALFLAACGGDPDEAPSMAELSLPRSLASDAPFARIEDPEQEPDGSRRDREKESRPKFSLSLGVTGRWTTPFGAANRDVYYLDNPSGGVTLVFDSNLRWNDVFHSGWGTSITAEIMTFQAGRGDGEGRGRANSSMGGYISFEQDHFSGEKVTDGRGNSFHVDDLSMNCYFVGPSVYQTMGGGAFMEGRVGLGAVHYAQVDATYNFIFSPEFRSSFLADTWNFAMEFRGGGGYRFGPIAVTLGLGFRMLLPPAEGDAATLESGILWTFDIDLGVEIGF